MPGAGPGVRPVPDDPFCEGEVFLPTLWLLPSLLVRGHPYNIVGARPDGVGEIRNPCLRAGVTGSPPSACPVRTDPDGGRAAPNDSSAPFRPSGRRTLT